MKKLTTTTLVCILGLATIGGAGYLLCDSFYEQGKASVSITESSKYFSISNLGKIGNEFNFARNNQKELQVTYNNPVYNCTDVYKYTGESVTNFSYRTGKTATLCAEFVSPGAGADTIEVYHDTEQLLYIQSNTQIDLADGGFTKKILYDAQGNILWQNKAFELNDLVGQTYVLNGEQYIMSKEGDSYILTYPNGERYATDNFLADMTFQMQDWFPQFEVSGPGKGYSLGGITFVVTNEELFGIRQMVSHNNGVEYYWYKLVNGECEQISSEVAIYPGCNYTEYFALYKTDTLTFAQANVNSFLPDVTVEYNGVTYEQDTSTNLSTLDEGIYRYINGADYIDIHFTPVNGLRISYQAFIGGELSEMVNEELQPVLDPINTVAGKTYQYRWNDEDRTITVPAEIGGYNIGKIMINDRSTCVFWFFTGVGSDEIYITASGDVYYRAWTIGIEDGVLLTQVEPEISE